MLARCLFVLTIALLSCNAAQADGPKLTEADRKKGELARNARAILAEHCFACHGNDPKHRQADLRLDTREGMIAKLEEGRMAVVPGKPEASELWKRITTSDPDQVMPPADTKKTLTAEQKAILKEWLAADAPWSAHWAFVPPTRPEPPATKNAGWVKNPIDAFILAKLEREGLKPSAEADKVTLLRRLSLDLIGLPPTIADVDAFLADSGPDAYAKQVDRLLASPHYGERWGRHWLDAARYADSDGYEKDKSREVWLYRDWVVSALNRDLPYDQFVIDQIAGDLLPGPKPETVATGFLRNSMVNEEGGIDPEQFRMEAMFDRMDAIGKSVLGITIQCAQCHTHKYDPLTHEEYYKLFAYLNNDHEAMVAAYPPEAMQKRDDVLKKIAALQESLKARTPDWRDRMAAWEEPLRTQPEWTVIKPVAEDISTGGQKYLPLADGSLLAAGYAPTKHRVKLTATVTVESIAAVRLELLNDPNLPLGGPGRSVQGTGALTEFEVEAAPASDPGKVQKLKIARATADVNPPEAPLAALYHDKSNKKRVTGPIEFALDGKEETAWGTDLGPGRRNGPRKAVFVLEQPVMHAGGTILTVYLSQKHGGWNSDDNQNCNLGRVRLSVTPAADAVADPLSTAARASLAVPREKRTEQDWNHLFLAWSSSVPEFKETLDQIEALWREHPENASQLALSAREEPRMTSILDRGDFLKPKQQVTPGVPSFLHALPKDAQPNRLALAEWLVDRKSPTTARVMMNRAWQTYFGTGIVSTSEDLGSQCEPPTHPELLDWLAVEFMDRGWSLKQMHRLIVGSATYRQSSTTSPELLARDPFNRLLARGARVRVEGEIVRDIAMSASGLLNPKLGGPSVYPPAPEFLFQPPVSYGPKIWNHEQGENRYRRSLYAFRYRSVPLPSLTTFDTPNGEFSCVRRTRSNTPLQALVTLNEPFFLECSQALALATVSSGAKSDGERLEHAFRRVLARKPNEAEARELLALYQRQADRLQDPVKAWLLAVRDPKQPPALPEGTTPAQLAAWTAVSRVLLNLDETITRE